jgi:radical SAM superfamily enzyme YgiQ (UPF0313 family)
MKKILLTTTYRTNGYYDYWAANTRCRLLRLAWLRKRSMGLRFLRHNLPGIEILEFPTRGEFDRRVASGRYDVVGISFYLDDTDRALEMVRQARRVGIAEIWGGNYGVLTPGVGGQFDRTFVGYAEDGIAEELGVEKRAVRHPPIAVEVSTPFGLRFMRLGILFTSRGCTVGCAFCQTPTFCPTAAPMPLNSIDEVLREYTRRGIREIQILDENFGLFPEHTEEVISLLERYGLYWYPMTRADILDAHLEDWHRRGLLGAFVAIENLTQQHLDAMGKGLRVDTALRLAHRMRELDLFVIGYYMIGFAEETRDSILADMQHLAELGLDLYQLCVVTPLPATPFGAQLESRYGITTGDHDQYDMKRLVWNHPHIAVGEMPQLLDECFRTVHSPRSLRRTLAKSWRRYSAVRGRRGALPYVLTNMWRAHCRHPW